ncbi:MAG: hypothetical protein DRG31_01735 [Deltaproteobacteria bacterium]|nr:MAG: hypothetical protein DRG31_01735 [Deltaproteobacteria bacterium]
MSISRIQKATRYPDRCLAGHPLQSTSSYLIPLVEITPSERTAPEAASWILRRRPYRLSSRSCKGQIVGISDAGLRPRVSPST